MKSNLVFRLKTAVLLSVCLVCQLLYATGMDLTVGGCLSKNKPGRIHHKTDTLSNVALQDYIRYVFEEHHQQQRTSGNFDTLVHDLGASTTIGSFITFPVYTKSQNTIYSVDFEIKFNQLNITFDTVTCLDSNISYLYYFNPNDSVLRLTSHSLIPVPSGSPIFEIKISSLNNELCQSDFQFSHAYLNGDLSVNTITNCIINTSTDFNSGNQSYFTLFPNPADEEISILHGGADKIYFTDVNGKAVELKKTDENNNTSVFKTGSLMAGMYFVKIYNDHSVTSKKFVILHPLH